MHWTEQLLIGLIVLAFVAVIVGSSQGSQAVQSVGQLITSLAQNVVGTGGSQNA